MIPLYHKMLENFMRFILQEGFWFVPVPFVRMVKLQFLAQFLVDHLLHTVVSSLALLLRKFSVYNLINRLVSITLQSTLAILLRFIDFRFNIIGSYGSVLCC